MYDSLLDTLAACVECGSMRKAAQKLFITPTAVHKQIQALEKKYHVNLFEKNRKKFILTAEGQYFYQGAMKIRQMSFCYMQSLQLIRFADLNIPAINFGVSLMTPAVDISTVLDLFLQYHPDTKINLISLPDNIRNWNELEEIMDENNIHCLCVPNDEDYDENRYGFSVIGYTDLCFAVPPGNALYGKEQISLSEIHDQTVLTNAKGNTESYSTIRNILKNICTNVSLRYIDQFVTTEIINECIEQNCILLTFDKWALSHPTMKITKISGNYSVPYGILYRKELSSKTDEN